MQLWEDFINNPVFPPVSAEELQIFWPEFQMFWVDITLSLSSLALTVT